MKVTRLMLTNVRAFQQAVFEFKEGMNLLVGVNGAGKSTVLDVLRILFSQTLPQFTPASKQAFYLSTDSIRLGQDSLQAEMTFEVSEVPFSITSFVSYEQDTEVTKQRGQFRIQSEIIEPTDPALRTAFDLDRSRDDQGRYITPPRFSFEESQRRTLQYLKSLNNHPIVVLFSTHRSLTSMRKPTKTSNSLLVGAYRDSLVDRELRLRVFGDWWRVQDTFSANDTNARRRLQALNDAITHFLGAEYRNLRSERDERRDVNVLLLDKLGQTFDVRSLSDGERGMIAVVADIARRLSLANPNSNDPLTEGTGVILIDELDLHLHPAWQRTVCERLKSIFPNCQFIATTHSPQIIGEVPAEQILLIKQDGIERPDQSLGMDSGWILRHLMDVRELNETIAQKLDAIETLIEQDALAQAKAVIRELKPLISDSPELARLQTRIDVLEMLGGS